jgi:hypothetical protein
VATGFESGNLVAAAQLRGRNILEGIPKKAPTLSGLQVFGIQFIGENGGGPGGHSASAGGPKSPYSGRGESSVGPACALNQFFYEFD